MTLWGDIKISLCKKISKQSFLPPSIPVGKFSSLDITPVSGIVLPGCTYVLPGHQAL